MDIVDVEMLLLVMIVSVSYLLLIVNWLFHVHSKSKLQGIKNIEEFKKTMWVFRHRSAISLSEIRSKLIEMGEKAKKRLNIYFIVGFPSLWFLINVILIKHIGRYYIKKKYNFDLPATNLFNYVGTLVVLSIWTSGALINKLAIHRIDYLIKKADEIESSASGK